jgi:hypothetical protein
MPLDPQKCTGTSHGGRSRQESHCPLIWLDNTRNFPASNVPSGSFDSHAGSRTCVYLQAWLDAMRLTRRNSSRGCIQAIVLYTLSTQSVGRGTNRRAAGKPVRCDSDPQTLVLRNFIWRRWVVSIPRRNLARLSFVQMNCPPFATRGRVSSQLMKEVYVQF